MDKCVVFLGDSITDCFHKLNVDPDRLGNGYVRLAADALREKGRRDFIRNSGHDGFTVSGLLRMFEYDCLRFEPDIVSILIGSNDAAVAMNTGKSLEQQNFRGNYEKLLQRICKETRAKILCMGPFIFPKPLEYAGWIPVIRQVEEIEKEAAREYGAIFVPLHDRLNREAEKEGYDAITVDGTHLTERGAKLLADIWLDEIRKQKWMI